MAEIAIRPATPEHWADVVAVFGRRGDDASWCWCRTLLTPGPPLEGSGRPDNRRALHDEVRDATVPPGLIAFLDGEPVGWSRVGPRSGFAGVTGNRTLARVLPAEPDAWWVTCFSTRPHARGLGVGTALLEAGAVFARSHGARVLEGYPVDALHLTAKRVGASALYTGTQRLFEAAGFTEVARPSPTRPLMRRVL